MTAPRNVIRRRFEVEDSGRTATHGLGNAVEPIAGAGGNLLFIDMPGSGRRALARAAAQRLGLAYAEASFQAGPPHGAVSGVGGLEPSDVGSSTGASRATTSSQGLLPPGEEPVGDGQERGDVLNQAGVAMASEASLEALLARSGQAIAVLEADLGDPRARELLRAGGKVFYLMSLAHILAARLEAPSRLEELAQAMAVHEPFFLQAAHFVLPIDATPEEMADDVVMKARLE